MDSSHIPVIFLTAKNDIARQQDQRLEDRCGSLCRETVLFQLPQNADRILLYNRQKEREAFSKRPFFPTNKMQMNKVDEEFMNKVIRTIEENIIDTNLNVEHLCRDSGHESFQSAAENKDAFQSVSCGLHPFNPIEEGCRTDS